MSRSPSLRRRQPAPALVAAAAAAAVACMGAAGPGEGGVERLRVEVVRTLAHDPASFTQGLVLAGGGLYESRGQFGESSLRRLDRETGELLAEVPLAPDLFGEGLAAVGDRLIQLTWQAGVAIVWRRESLAELDRLAYAGEGWGLCWDGRRLYQSDGSDRLTVRDGDSLAPLGRVAVTLEGRPVDLLNELECAEGWIYANRLGYDEILRIDPHSGRVGAVIDASGMLTAEERLAADVLNGIAHDPESGTFLLTGKLWPKMFEVHFRE